VEVPARGVEPAGMSVRGCPAAEHAGQGTGKIGGKVGRRV